MLAAALLNYADDEGFFNANARLVKAQCVPLREDSVSVHDSLIMLSDAGFIRLGDGSDGKRYGHIVKFLDHQRINRPTPSKISGITVTWHDSLSPHTQLTESSLPEGKGRERKGREHAPSRKGLPLPAGPSLLFFFFFFFFFFFSFLSSSTPPPEFGGREHRSWGTPLVVC
jgi:hypothetical protein